jgi:membrane-bound lytic murein transglycosylase D
MIRGVIWVMAATLSCAALGAERTVTFDELLDQGRQLLEENLDPAFLEQLGEWDEAEAERWLRQVQRALEGEYVIDLAALREHAKAALPWIEGFAELRPYAAWLRARMDYFEVADRLRILVPSPERVVGESPPPPRHPSYAEQQQVWRSVVVPEPPFRPDPERLARLRAIFSAAGVPQELVWLAEVESSFDPRARSPSGAVGLYQLMPDTAKALGLTVEPQDERLVPDKNAGAAARHLRHLYGLFRDWPLAIAAYNAGEGRVGKALKARGARRFDQITSQLPAETQLYVPKVEAVLQRRETKRLKDLPAVARQY